MKNSKVMALVLGAIVGILAVGVAYAAFASTLQINGDVQLGAEWIVKYTASNTEVTKGSTSSTVTANFTEDATMDSPKTVLVGHAKLTAPGDVAVFNYTISNLGTLDADLENQTLICAADAAFEDVIPCENETGDWKITASALSKTTLAAKNGDTVDSATGSITATWVALDEQPEIEITDNPQVYFKLVTNATQA